MVYIFFDCKSQLTIVKLDFSNSFYIFYIKAIDLNMVEAYLGLSDSYRANF